MRDRDPAALQHPPPDLFHGFGTVRYRHLTEPGPLPAAAHYVFNCERLSRQARDLLARVDGAQSVTVIVSRVDDWIVPQLDRRRLNLLPAYGDADQISIKTLRRALRLILSGGRVVARGFVQNSLDGATSGETRRLHPFLQLIAEASAAANSSAATSAGVLALQRTGSKYLRDLIGMTVSGRARVFHEHDLPGVGTRPDATRPLFDQLALEMDVKRKASLRTGILHDVLLRDRRYLFVTERNPDERLASYFVKRQSGWLAARFDAERGCFRAHDEISKAYSEWCAGQVLRQRHWYDQMLARPFGVDVRRAVPVGSGLLLARSGQTAMLVIPLRCFAALERAVADAFGEDSLEALSDNSARARGDEDLYAAFRRDFPVPPAESAELWDIPEVRHIHGARPG